MSILGWRPVFDLRRFVREAPRNGHLFGMGDSAKIAEGLKQLAADVEAGKLMIVKLGATDEVRADDYRLQTLMITFVEVADMRTGSGGGMGGGS